MFAAPSVIKAEIVALLAAALVLAAPPLPQASAQSGPPRIEIAQALGADDIELYADKLDVYARLLAGTSRTVTNALRYLKSFDFKTGPKGTETSSYDLVDLNGERYAELIRAAREAAADPPAIPELDKAALAYADAVATNAAVYNEAARYYSSDRAYERDRYRHGKELHPKIAHELERFFATLPPFMTRMNQARAAVDPQEIAAVEKVGRAPARALARQLMIAGRQAALFVPTNTSRDIDTAGFDAAIQTYADQADAYAAYRQSPAGRRDRSLTSQTDGRVTGLLRELRDIREAYDMRRQIFLRYELLVIPFYEEYGDFWSEMLAVVERNPWRQTREQTVAGPTPLPDVTLPEVDDRQLEGWRRKVRAMQDLVGAAEPLVRAWNRYTEWVDPRRGPTGRETGVGSFAAIDRFPLEAVIDTARGWSRVEPLIEPVDPLLVRYGAAIERVLPVAAEASGYYERRDFLGDRMEGGKALHPRLTADYAPFLETRAELSRAVQSLREQIEGRELVLLEQREGRTLNWQRRNVVRLVQAVHAAVPRKRDPNAADLERFDRLMAELADAVRTLEAARDPASSDLVRRGNGYIGELRQLRREYDQPGDMFNSHLISLNTSYAVMIDAARDSR